MGWLLDEIVEGMQKLTALALPSHPPAETIDLTALAWLEALEPRNFQEDLDRWRIREAFRQLLRDCDRWPYPKQLIDRLPPRKELARLPPPEIDWERQQANMAKLKAALKPILDRGTS